MKDEQLRSRIAASDPVLGGADIDPADSPSARTLLEAIMSTDLDHDNTDTSTTDHSTTETHIAWAEPKRRRWGMAVLGAAAVAALAVGGAALGDVFDSGDDTDVAGELPADELPVDETPGDQPVEEPVIEPNVLALSGGDTDPTMMSCIVVDSTIIAQSQLAFRGIVDSVEGDTVTLTVDHWYVGGDADVVTVTAPLGLEALIGSIDFVVGEPYLISAWDGVVSYCGMSGAATPELQQMYDQAFPG